MSHTEKKEETCTVGDRGRLVLPASVRRELGLKKGDRVSLKVNADGEMRIISLREVARRFRGAYAHLAPGRSLVDELIAERREEARREGEGL
ncbi:MAG: AbrB/MazE/SpoVT family DNA-binding domain-containing protein [Rubrobacter sp.]|jgi:AbrB family looped-hinge helix DNA binding protein|nr:AbrB/MazE/SpoVT family DNA-binding domain-containing protein [Rubrobacter sp.]